MRRRRLPAWRVRADGGFVITSAIGTNDSSATLVYQPPPGVIDEADVKGGRSDRCRDRINEHSMRIQAGNFRCTIAPKRICVSRRGRRIYQAFKRMRVWGRGRGNGWGPNGDLQMFVKVGRDENNFYLYRAPMDAGSTQAGVDRSVDRLQPTSSRCASRFRRPISPANQESIACTGVDSAIVAASLLPIGIAMRRFAACDDGYMVYTLDPAVTAPNLAAVQELAAGLIRAGEAAARRRSARAIRSSSGSTISDSSGRQRDGRGGAGERRLNAADLGDVRHVSNKDPNLPASRRGPDVPRRAERRRRGTLHLDRMLPEWGSRCR